MNDILMIPAPAFCNGQRFNLFISTRSINRAPIVGYQLVELCKGSSVNPFVLGCIAHVLTNEWRNTDAIKRGDYWVTGGQWTTWIEAGASALKSAVVAGSLDAFGSLTLDQIALVRALYAKFVRFSESMAGLPVDDRAPISTPNPAPVPPAQSPAPVPPSTPAPSPAPAPQPEPGAPAVGGKWKSTLKGVIGALGAVVTIGGIFIPDQYEAIIRAVIAALKAFVGGF
jgi:hypothetical protein